jgi:hypothetical protein
MDFLGYRVVRFYSAEGISLNNGNLPLFGSINLRVNHLQIHLIRGKNIDKLIYFLR